MPLEVCTCRANGPYLWTELLYDQLVRQKDLKRRRECRRPKVDFEGEVFRILRWHKMGFKECSDGLHQLDQDFVR